MHACSLQSSYRRITSCECRHPHKCAAGTSQTIAAAIVEQTALKFKFKPVTAVDPEVSASAAERPQDISAETQATCVCGKLGRGNPYTPTQQPVCYSHHYTP